jgi:hypothetical protein
VSHPQRHDHLTLSRLGELPSSSFYLQLFQSSVVSKGAPFRAPAPSTKLSSVSDLDEWINEDPGVPAMGRRQVSGAEGGDVVKLLVDAVEHIPPIRLLQLDCFCANSTRTPMSGVICSGRKNPDLEIELLMDASALIEIQGARCRLECLLAWLGTS